MFHRLVPLCFTACLLVAPSLAAAAVAPTVKTFDYPGRTEWRPEGCRSVPAEDPIIGRHSRWRLLHSDIASSDEVSIAFAPAFESDWKGETDKIFVTVPTFDSHGNLYAVPYLPHENVALVSVNPDTGARRFAIAGTGAPVGACSPITLDDPDNAGEDIIYVTLKDRAFAVRPDGSVVWDVPTGLTLTGVNTRDSTSGNSYLPQRDAIVGLTTGGELYLLDRTTGAQILDAPFNLPGEPSPAGSGVALTPDIIEEAEEMLGQFVAFPEGSSFEAFLAAILGNGIEVSNSFSVDANTGRLWIAATAPDAADGNVDGVSSLGALYGLDVVDGMSGPEISIHCRRDFVGGSASTPDVTADGTRIYVGDNDGKMLALDQDCGLVWEVDLGSQITGSVATSSDNHEIYASTQTDIVKIVDNGATGSVEWTASFDNYDVTPEYENYNTLLAGIGANGVNFMAGAGVPPGDIANIGLPIKIGYGVLDRETGEVRYFADGLDESVAEMNSGPDGAYYNSNSPIRRTFSKILMPALTAPIEGGIHKFKPKRNDLLVRDAICAAADRAQNAEVNVVTCPDSAAADTVTIDDLLKQVERVGPVAVTDGDLTAAKWDRLATLVAEAEVAPLAEQATLLPRACAISWPCPVEPETGCLAATKSSLQMKRKIGADPNQDRFSWKWSKGAAFGDSAIGDPLDDADYGLCVWTNADASPALVYETSVPASSDWETKTEQASWKTKDADEDGLTKLKVKGGSDGKTQFQAKGSSVGYSKDTFVVDAPVVVQAFNLATGTCWSSRFESGDAVKSDDEQFKAKTPQ